MRFKTPLLISLLALTATSALAASVLVPEDKKSTSTASQGATSMGLLPKTPEAAQVPEATQKLPTDTVPAPVLDSVNKDLMKSVRLEDIKKALPAEMRDISDAELTKILGTSLDATQSTNYQKFLKKDPKTGKYYLDTAAMQKVQAPEKSIQIRTGDGRIEPKVPTKQEVQIAKMVAARGGPGKLPPYIEQGRAMLKIEQAEEAKKKERDPHFINDLPLEPYESGILQNAILIGLAKNYTWGQRGVAVIKSALGYEGDDILSHCQLRLNVYLNTDDNQTLYRLPLYSNTQQTVKYGGNLRNFEVTPVAVCVKPMGNMPRHGDVIFKVGDKYGVSLSKAKCDAPPYDPNKKPVETALISYNGDEKIECTFK